jgi:hypothetical protein
MARKKTDVGEDRLLSLYDVAAHPLVAHADGRPMQHATVYRWTRSGVVLPDGSKMRLAVVHGGGINKQLFVYESALRAFVEGVNEARAAARA